MYCLKQEWHASLIGRSTVSSRYYLKSKVVALISIMKMMTTIMVRIRAAIIIITVIITNKLIHNISGKKSRETNK
jgi:hypothetical protein